MSQSPRKIEAIESLVDKGIYSPNFEQPNWAKEFVLEVIQQIMNPSMRIVLECGMGTGFWLKFLQSVYHSCYFYGFDISKKILEIAQMNLTGGSVILREGDILKDESFQYRGISSFDIIFCYNVIQQLSDEDYMIAIQNMLNHLNHNGVAIIFDNEKYSLYGLIMSCKKLLTKFLRVPLVPYEFCEVKYPPLRILNKQIQELGYKSQLYIAKNKIKRALVIYGK